MQMWTERKLQLTKRSESTLKSSYRQTLIKDEIFDLFTCTSCDHQPTSENREHAEASLKYWNTNFKVSSLIIRSDCEASGQRESGARGQQRHRSQKPRGPGAALPVSQHPHNTGAVYWRTQENLNYRRQCWMWETWARGAGESEIEPPIWGDRATRYTGARGTRDRRTRSLMCVNLEQFGDV